MIKNQSAEGATELRLIILSCLRHYFLEFKNFRTSEMADKVNGQRTTVNSP